MPKRRKPTPEELARRLRENLRRRKAQQRARRQRGVGACAWTEDAAAGEDPPSSAGLKNAGSSRDHTKPGGGD